MTRRPAFALLLVLSGCSFIDDFDRYHTATRERDGGARDANMDAEPDDDASQDADADAASEADAEQDGEVVGDDLCLGKSDGTPCGEADELLCLKGFCRTSRCGDGYVDSKTGEQCDDLNLVRRDGCEPGSCQFSCTVAADCSNGVVCDGEEQCDVARHRCIPDPLSSVGKACLSRPPANLPGQCDDSGYCVAEGCGNGMLDEGEDCDGSLGCRPDCSQGCTVDTSCDDNDVCNGVETCLVARGECRPGTPLSCVDGDPCSLDGQCSPSTGCSYPLDDPDGDGFAVGPCAPGSGLKGGDCEPDNGTAYPGARESCDMKDNNCNGQMDELPLQTLVCYPDADRDGYPTRQGARMDCRCPAGTRTERPDGLWDCHDSPAGGADVHPGQTAYFGTGYPVPCAGGSGTCVSYDYDCNGSPEGRWRAGTGTCGALSLGCRSEGYAGAAPPCGQSKRYVVCEPGLLSCQPRESSLQQLCH